METDDETLMKTLSWETLRVYQVLLNHNPSEVTLDTLASELNLKKPTVLHHLEKLLRVNIIEKTLQGYKVTEVIRVQIIRNYSMQLKTILRNYLPVIIIFSFFLPLFIILDIHFLPKIIGFSLSLFGLIKTLADLKQLW